MEYVLIDCCPVPTQLAPVVAQTLKESGATLQSCYRGVDARAQLARCGKHDQTYLYNGWLKRLPGFNPANPPGRSTHELRSDGVAYRGPVGRKLPYWGVGMDVDDAHVTAFKGAAAKRGWVVFSPYPTSSLEHHHLNFKKEPAFFRSLKQGSVGPRVLWVQSWLYKLGYLHVKGNGIFGPKTKLALEAFQRKHHLAADGVYGAHSSAQLHASARAWKRGH